MTTARYVSYPDWDSDPCDGNQQRGHTVNTSYQTLFEGNRGTVDRTEYMTCKHCGTVIWGYHIIEELDTP